MKSGSRVIVMHMKSCLKDTGNLPKRDGTVQRSVANYNKLSNRLDVM